MVIQRRGQTTTEYILMLAILTLIGVWIVNGVGGRTGLTSLSGDKGAIKNMSVKTTDKIAKD